MSRKARTFPPFFFSLFFTPLIEIKHMIAPPRPSPLPIVLLHRRLAIGRRAGRVARHWSTWFRIGQSVRFPPPPPNPCRWVSIVRGGAAAAADVGAAPPS